MNTLNSIKLYLADTISEQLQIKKDFSNAVIDALTKTRNKNFCNDCKYNLKEKCEGCIAIFISNEEQQEQLVFIDNCLYDEICELQYKYHIGIIGCCCGREMSEMISESFIQVSDEFVPKMYELGYKQRPIDEYGHGINCFYPKTTLNVFKIEINV